MSTLLRTIADILLAPFTWLPPEWGVVGLSVACGLLFLLAFRLAGPRRRLKRVKSLMSSTIYEMRVFASYPGRVLAAQGRALIFTGCYLILTLPALLLVAPVLGVILVRASTWYEFRPLKVGEEAVLTVWLDPGVRRSQLRVEAQGQGGVAVRPPVVLLRSRGQAMVRLRAVRAGRHAVRVTVGEEVVHKSVPVGGGGPVSLVRGRGPLAALLGHEPALAARMIRRVELELPAAPVRWVGVPWYVIIVLLSLPVALLLRRRLGVVF